MKSDFVRSFYEEVTGKEIESLAYQFLNDVAELLIEYPEDPLEPPSSAMIPLSLSCGKNYYESVAAAVNTFGENHFVFSNVYDYLSLERSWEWRGKIPGLGHPVYTHKNPDPRVIKVKKLGIKWFDWDINYGKMASLSNSWKLPINLAGAVTPFLMRCGFTRNNIDSFPLICRMVGLTKIYKTLADSGQIKLGPSQKILRRAKRICSKS